MEDSKSPIIRQTITGVVALISRTFVLELFFASTSIIIFSILSQAEVGIYTVVVSIQQIISFITDFGFGAALVQKKEELTSEDIRTSFTLQFTLTLSIFIIVFLSRGFIQSFFHLNSAGLNLLLVLVFTIFLSSFKVIPSILLERRIHFHKLILPQMVETITFNVLLLFLVINHFGINSYTWAFLVSGIISIPFYYFVSPWEVKFGVDKKALGHLRFGLQFQAKNVLATVKDNFLTVILAKFLPFAQIGYIGFAQNLAFYPYRYFVDSVTRVTFSTYARMQDDVALLRKTIEKSLFFISLIMFPVLTGLIVVAPYIIHYFPHWHNKWEGAYVSLVFFSLNAMLSSLSGILVNVLDSNGQVKLTLRLMTLWTALTWILTPILIFVFSYNGVAIASFIVTLTIVYTIYLVKKVVTFDLIKSVNKPAIAAAIMGIAVYFVSTVVVHSLLTVIIVSIGGAGLYVGIMYLFSGKEVIQDIKIIIKR